MKKISLILIIACILSLNTAASEINTNNSHQLKVYGNKLVWADDESVGVTLSGVSVCGAEWLANPENDKVRRSVNTAINEWHCNVIRLPVSGNGWWGEYEYITDGGKKYREYIKNTIADISAAGKYVILDYHKYQYADERTLNFWEEASVEYKNNPSVLFGILNEPYGIGWDEWRNGNGAENIGLQRVVEAIRDNGAKNIIVAGGIDYANSLDGITQEGGYALADCGSGGDTELSGYGIMYDCHVYPWHKNTENWKERFGAARLEYPLLMGEFGWDNAINLSVAKTEYKPGDRNYHDKWFDELEAWLNDDITYGSKMNFTSWAFHYSAGPKMLEKTDLNGNAFGSADYAYTPTEYCGKYVKKMLERRCGENIALRASGNIEDGDVGTYISVKSGDEITLNLGGEFAAERWGIVQSGVSGVSVYTSTDGETFELADSVRLYSENTERYIKKKSAKYVRLKIDGASESAKISEFMIYGENLERQAQQLPESLVPYVEGSDSYADFTAGKRLEQWYASNGAKTLYTEGTASDGVSRSMCVSANALYQYGITGTFGNMAGIDAISYRYKSECDFTIWFVLDYRVSGIKKTTKKVTIPSTDGEWTSLKLPIEAFMRSEDDTWVKNDMKTVYNEKEKKYEPCIIMYLQKPESGNINIEKITNIKYEKVGVEFVSADFTDEEFRFRLRNNGTLYADNVCVYAAAYDKNGRLAYIKQEVLSIAPKSNSDIKTVKIKKNDGYIKIYMWGLPHGMTPITKTSVYGA